MRARIVCVIVAASLLTGCLHDLGLDADFGKVVLTVRLLGAPNEAWQNESFRLVLREPTLKQGKQEPGPQGGGGAVFNLTRPLNLTLEARLEDSERFGDAKASWTVYDDRFRLLHDSQRPGDEGLNISITKPGRIVVNVALGKGLRLDEVWRRIEFVLDRNWVVESAVQPVGPAATARAPTMHDRFEIGVEDRRTTIEASTQFRGAWPGPHGTNVDLSIQKAARTFECKGTGGGGRPGPEQATETLRAQNLGFTFAPVLFVGGQPEGCPGGGAPAGAYTNAFLVPYRVYINMTHPHYGSTTLRNL